MTIDRISARLSEQEAEFVRNLVGQNGLYLTRAEYLRDLIRRDLEQDRAKKTQAQE